MRTPGRIFVLLSAYEDLTDRETSALRRGDIQFAIALETRKLRLAEHLGNARRQANLSRAEIAAFEARIERLQEREKANLAFLRGEMDRVGAELSELNRATRRSRQVRRGYGTQQGLAGLREGLLGRA
ncbi:MAG: flagellar protein FliT [Verrucomicrobia bacterium]|nr:MAG: flagellar protein FliT [Verrucomicrobiota bacterium]